MISKRFWIAATILLAGLQIASLTYFPRIAGERAIAEMERRSSEAAEADPANPNGPPALSARDKAILSHTAQKDWPVIVFGDSVTELAQFSQICGRDALNAGVSTRRAGEMTRLVREVMAISDPDIVFIALGVNDAWRDAATSSEEFVAAMRELAQLARAKETRVVLVEPSPVHDSPAFDPALVEQRAREVRSLGLPTAAPIRALDADLTHDGTHPNARGYAEWLANLEAACP